MSQSKTHNTYSPTEYIPDELRVGFIAELYYKSVIKKPVPKQADFFDTFFPGLIIDEIASDGVTKQPAEYDPVNRRIGAVKYKGKFYISGSRQVTQILGRLFGTAKSSIEKERATAAGIEKRVTNDLCALPELINSMIGANENRIRRMSRETLIRFIDVFDEYVDAVKEKRGIQSLDEKELELFPIEDETFQVIMENIDYQRELKTTEGLSNAFTWLLLFALLRNECGRLNMVYISSFRERRSYRHLEPRVEIVMTDDPELDGYEEAFYEGDDLDKRFPGIEWYCDRCGEYLNEQPGFDDHLHEWRCLRCGYKNRIEIDNIYDSGKNIEAGDEPVDEEEFYRALKERTEEKDNEENPV